MHHLNTSINSRSGFEKIPLHGVLLRLYQEDIRWQFFAPSENHRRHSLLRQMALQGFGARASVHSPDLFSLSSWAKRIEFEELPNL
ncbi:unnamed protein product [Victoria cruziana]